MTGYLSSTLKAYLQHYAGLSSTCWQGIFINLVESTLVGICYFLPFYFVNELNLSIATAGVIISFYGLGTMIGGFIGGKLSDKTSPGFISVLCLLTQAAAFVALTQFHSIYFLMLNLLIIGMASYGFITANYLWVLEQCHQESEKLKAVSILGTVANLGLGIAAIIISSLSHFSFHYILLIFSAALFAAAIYFSFQERKETPVDPLDKNNNVATQQNEFTAVQKNKKIFRVVLSCLFLVGLIIAQMGSTYPIYIHDAFPEMGINGFSLLFGMNAFFIVFVQTPLVNLFNDDNKMLVLGAGTFLVGFGMFMLIFSMNFFLAIISCLIYTVGEMLFFSMSQLVCYQQSKKNKKGYSFGLYRMIYAFARFVGPVTGGLVYQLLGGNVIWYLCGFIGVIGLSICVRYKKYV